MSEITNISTVDLSSPVPAKRYFNNFFVRAPISFSSNQHDALLSFFEVVTNDEKAAKSIAAAVIYTGKRQGIDPMQILEKFRTLKGAELSRTLALFLNYYRYGSSLLGVSSINQSNMYVTRSVLF